jgi:hypothetical protein
MPAVLREIASEHCPSLEPYALDLSLAVLDLLGGPDYAKAISKSGAVGILESTLVKAVSTGYIGDKTKTDVLVVFSKTGEEPEVSAATRALADKTNKFGNANEKQLVGNLLDSWQYWNSHTNKAPADLEGEPACGWQLKESYSVSSSPTFFLPQISLSRLSFWAILGHYLQWPFLRR